MRQFLGKGWAFPVRLSESGAVELSAYEKDVAEAIRIILFTKPGERVMRPDFGCGIHRFVFDSVNVTQIGLIETAIREALIRYEPRIDIIALQVELDGHTDGKLFINLTYRVRMTNNEFNQVYPFYFREG